MYREILPLATSLDPSVSVSFVGRPHAKVLPQYPHICSTLDQRRLRPARVFSSLARYSERSQMLRRVASTDGCPLWHPTYYTPPTHSSYRSVLFVYDMIHERFPYLFDSPQDDAFRRRKAEVISSAQHVIAISHATADDIHHMLGIERSRISVAHLAISADFNTEDNVAPASAHNRPYLLYVGDRRHYKGFFDFAHGYSRWSHRHEVQVLVVGRPFQDWERQWLTQQGLSASITMVSTPSDRELKRLYSGATAFVYPSLYEGFGIPLLEAMSCGRPVVASNIPSTQEVAGSYPYYFTSGCTDSLLMALTAALHDDGSRAQWGKSRVNEFSWTDTARQFLKACRSVV